jgi:S-DNA-T family DNA segregation ATPase FtsK/SpoIIIE
MTQRGSPSRKKDNQSASDKPDSPNWQNRLDRWQLRFDRFGWDILGVLSLSLGLITLLGLVHLSEGRIVSWWVDFLNRWLGWGSYFAVISLAVLGIFCLRKHSEGEQPVRLGRVLALEGIIFATMALLGIFGGNSLARAESGLDGGVIGWSLASIFSSFLPAPLDIILLSGIILLLALYGFGFFTWAARRVEVWAEKVASEPAISPEDLDTLSEEKPSRPTSLEAETGESTSTGQDDKEIPSGYPGESRRRKRLPPLNILRNDQLTEFNPENVHQTAADIEKTLAEFGIPARVVGYRVGPVVTQFAVEPGYVEKTGQDGETIRQKVRVSQISALSRDLTLALSAERLRIEAPVPGQSFVGIEVPNSRTSMVGLRSILESEAFWKLGAPLGIALGKDVSGRPVVADLARMPHLLIAGTTGSGKSVCIAAVAVCLAMNNTPEQLKLVMLDPKMVELVRFNGLRHLLGKVETEPERILAVLRWALAEMDRRYRLLEAARARNLEAYNQKMMRKKEETLPNIVILIDELADLMLSAPDQTEHSIVRLAQMARATGIHLVLATQRPSTDVITGLIKANFPARISFTVASSIDSRVILDETGAETLLGKGDMLFLNPENGKPVRAQGVIVTDSEIEKLVEIWEKIDLSKGIEAPWEEILREVEEDGADQLIDRAIEIVRKTQRASASMLQRRLRIGYPRAARLIDELEELGIVGPSQGGGRERDVLIAPQDEADESEESENWNENGGDEQPLS